MQKVVNAAVLPYISIFCLDSRSGRLYLRQKRRILMACNEGWKIVDRYIETLEDLGNGWERGGFPHCLSPLDAIAEDIVGHLRGCEACSDGSLPTCTSHRKVLSLSERATSPSLFPNARYPETYLREAC
jgi:hypothetical protein